MICPTCSEETSIHHENDGLCFLFCGHTARHNPGATLWSGYLDDIYVTIDFTNKELVPSGNMHTLNKWTDTKCPVCFEDKVPLSMSHAQGITRMHLACGHVIDSDNSSAIEAKLEIEPIPQEEHTVDNIPKRGLPTEVAPNNCSVCGIAGGDYRLSTLPGNVRTCGHGFSKDATGVIRRV